MNASGFIEYNQNIKIVYLLPRVLNISNILNKKLLNFFLMHENLFKKPIHILINQY